MVVLFFRQPWIVYMVEKEKIRMVCQNCYADIPPGVYRCPECGAPVLQPEPDTGH